MKTTFRGVAVAVVVIVLGTFTWQLTSLDQTEVETPQYDATATAEPRTRAAADHTAPPLVERIVPAHEERSIRTPPLPTTIVAAEPTAPAGWVGIVENAQGDALAGISVRLCDVTELTVRRRGRSRDALVPGELLVKTTTSAADGTFRLADVAPQRVYAMTFDDGGSFARHVERVSIARATRAGADFDLGRFVLTAERCRARGHVVDEDGTPLAGAMVADAPARAGKSPDGRAVLVVDRPGGGIPFRAQEGRSAGYGWDDVFPSKPVFTGPDGSFDLPARSSGRTSFDLLVRSDSHLAVTRSSAAIPDGVVDVGTIVLAAGAMLVGTVVDDLNQPVAGAEIYVGAQGESPEGIPAPIERSLLAYLERRTTTDRNGRFEIRGVTSTVHALAVTLEGRFAVTLATPGKDDARVILPPARELYLLVRDENGRPRGDVDLSVFAGPLATLAPLDLTTRRSDGGDGRIRLTRLMATEYSILIRAAGYEDDWVQVDLTFGATSIAHTLVPIVRPEFVVLDHDTGAPIREATIRAGKEGATTDANGRVTWSTPAPPNGLKVIVSAPGYVTADATAAAAAARVEVRLAPLGVLRGRVRTTAANAKIRASLVSLIDRRQRMGASTSLDAHGGFELRAAGGRYELVGIEIDGTSGAREIVWRRPVEVVARKTGSVDVDEATADPP